MPDDRSVATTPRGDSSPVDARLVAHAILIVFAWGTNYPLMKVALNDMGPLTFSCIRLAGGALVLAMIIAVSSRGPLWPAKGERLRLAVSGVVQYAGVLGFAGLALTVMPAGRTSVAVYSMPLWAALFAVLLHRERLTRRQWLGVFIGLVGLGLFFDPKVFLGATPVSVALVFAAAASWGLGAVIHRAAPFTTPPLSQAFFQLLCSGIVVAVLAVTFEAHHEIHLTSSLVAIMAWNWLAPTSLAVWSWSRVLARLSAATAGQLLMATPLVGMAASAVIFGETVPPVFALSATLIIAGSLLVLISRPAARGIDAPT